MKKIPDFKDFQPDMNFHYPFEDFQADIKGVEDAVQNKRFSAGRNLQIKEDDGQISELKFNDNHPVFQESRYFADKYGDVEGNRRHLKFRCVFGFVFGNLNLLVQNKLAAIVGGQPMYRNDFDDFLKYLLQHRVNPKDNQTPKKAIKGFFLWKQGN